MSDYFDAWKWGAVVPFHFYVMNLATTQAGLNLNVNTGTSTGITRPYAGSVVGITVSCNAAITTDVATFHAHKNGSTSGLTLCAAVINGTNSTGSYATIAPHQLKFAAGDRIGLAVTSGDAFAPATVDVDGVLWVQMNAV